MISPSDKPQSFRDVFADERREIQQRRIAVSRDGADESQSPRNLTGLALSGGGIRSATFCLGVLQALNEVKLLPIFDYVSTVSGGGFVGGWWSAWLSRQRDQGEIFPATERIEPERSDNYSAASRTGKLAESSISAGVDPIHHLRLFANYLTPRRGALSMDTWRAIGFIVRNLVLTWLVLLPVLLAAVLLGQVYFAVFSDDFPHENMATIQKTTSQLSRGQQVVQSLAHSPSDPEQLQLRKQTLRHRAFVAIVPVALLGGLTVFFAFCWIIGIQGGPRLLRIVNAGVGALLTIVLADVFLDIFWVVLIASMSIVGFLVVTAIVFRVRSNIVLLFRRLKHWTSEIWNEGAGIAHLLRSAKSRCAEKFGDSLSSKRDQQWQKEVYLNAMTRWMARSLIFMVATAAVLAVAGFGHEAVEYVCCYNAPGGSLLKSLAHYAAKSLSITSVFAAIAGLIYTWGKAAPTGGGDKADTRSPSPTSRLIFAITPPLAIAVIAVVMAWLAHALVSLVVANHENSIWDLTQATRLGIYFAFILVFLEMDLSAIPARALHLTLFALLFTNAAAIGWLYYRGEFKVLSIPASSFAVLAISAAILIGRFVAKTVLGVGKRDLRWLPYVVVGVFVYLTAAMAYHFIPQSSGIDAKWLVRISAVVIALAIFKPLVGRMTLAKYFTKEDAGYRRRFYLAIVAVPMLLAFLAFGLIVIVQSMYEDSLAAPGNQDVLDSAFKGIVRAGVVFLVLAFFQIWKLRGNHRSSWLATSLLLTLCLLVLQFIREDVTQAANAPPVVKAVTLTATAALTWVMTIGWIVDPNSLSIHAFYRSRLVRAYLGASNPVRKLRKKEVTEAVEGDDILLSDLQNCRQGGPYHLVNTTLNLVGGRDLTTAQRSSAMFVLSKNYCGSLRTGYRRTSDYMHGELSLGTALAVSGAAVSPNMGSMKTTASLAMLMTLLNVRLGYWAPTPNKDSWQSPQARLWPYYVLREFLSETTDLSSYCYLTDGGHFDNTGLYSLVERGCRYVIIIDGSADPGPCFADLGNAVRRCRIDFGAEIDIDITPLITMSKKDNLPLTNHVIGSVKYSESHFNDLGWEDASEEDRTGVLVYIKPGLWEKQPGLSVDVRQYAIENNAFPHQTTADQWFDEAQFESYRALGEQSVELMIGTLNVSQTQLYKRARRKQSANQKLNDEETNVLAADAVREKIVRNEFNLTDVPALLQALQGLRPA